MEQKIVSLEVAKAIKKAGYPMRKVICGRYRGEPVMYDEEPDEENWADCDAWYLPTYLDVWLWLWRKKGIEIELNGNVYQRIVDCYKPLREMPWDYDEESNPPTSLDPEEVIIAAIEYLVDNDLIK